METKKKYNSPRIEIIFLDNEISLALESSPPVGPGEGAQLLQKDLNINNPFKSSLT